MDSTLCQIETHDQQKIKYLCVDQKCQSTSKIGCADCFLENHVCQSTHSHQRIGIQKFETELTDKIESLRNVEITPLTNDNQQFEEDFSICLQQVTQRLNQFKDDLQKEVLNDVAEFDNGVEILKSNVEDIVQPIITLENGSLLNLSQEDIIKTVQFYQNSESIQDKLKKQMEQIESSRDKVTLKKQKITQKLYSTIDSILKELDVLIQSEQSIIRKNDNNNNIQGTPEKIYQPIQSVMFSGSSQTQSPPIKSLIEAARSKKYPIQPKKLQQKKTPMNIKDN